MSEPLNAPNIAAHDCSGKVGSKQRLLWKRFDRLSKVGVFEAFFDALASMSSSAHLIQMFELDDRARACVGGRGKGGQEGQALGRSRGGFTTKIHAKSDASGDIIAFDLTGGEASDARHFETLLDIGPDVQPRAAICDKGYASKANREAARERGIAPVIPHCGATIRMGIQRQSG